jgi:hypothetical protein
MSRVSSSSSRFVKAKLENISKGGCKLKMLDIQTGFAVGESIIINFNLHDFKIKKAESFNIEAQVRWAYPDGSQVGCQFMKIEPKVAKLFEQLLEILLKKE